MNKYINTLLLFTENKPQPLCSLNQRPKTQIPCTLVGVEIHCIDCVFSYDYGSEKINKVLRNSNPVSEKIIMAQSTVLIMMENLIKFININGARDAEGKSTLCKTEQGNRVRTYLPCDKKDPSGNYIIKCEDCPFSSKEAAEETILHLEKEYKKQKVYEMLKGNPIE